MTIEFYILLGAATLLLVATYLALLKIKRLENELKLKDRQFSGNATNNEKSLNQIHDRDCSIMKDDLLNVNKTLLYGG
jgi:hypothetical protein